MKLIHNAFERVVIERVTAEGSKSAAFTENPDLLADAACIALNMLPPPLHTTRRGFECLHDRGKASAGCAGGVCSGGSRDGVCPT
jgi:hypothetical protein